jgi:transposase
MSASRKSYTREFKIEAVRLMETSGKPIAVLERELGLSEGILHHWKRQLARDGGEAFPGKGHLLPTDDLIRQFRRENEILRQERDILKKALGICSQERR